MMTKFFFQIAIRRCLARLVDTVFLGGLGVFVFLFFSSIIDAKFYVRSARIIQNELWLLPSILMAFCCVIEVICVFLFQGTPGKWLLALRLESTVSKKISYTQSVHRMILVLFSGLGLTLPVVSAMTAIYQCREVMSHRNTSYDRNLTLKIQVLPITPLRVVLNAVVFGLFILNILTLPQVLDDEWHRYLYPEGHFESVFPHEPDETVTSFYNDDLNVDVRVYNAHDNLTDQYSVTVRQYSKPIPMDRISNLFDVLLAEIKTSVDLELEPEIFAPDDLFPRLDVTGKQKSTELQVSLRFIFDGKATIYILSAVEADKGPRVQEFLKSFRVVK